MENFLTSQAIIGCSKKDSLTENQRNYTKLNKDRLIAYLGKHALILDHVFVSCEKNVEFCGTHLTLYLPSHGR